MPNPKFRSPRRITDLAEFAGEYIEFMRAVPENSAPERLVQYAHDFFRDVAVDRRQLLALAVMVVDRIYRFAAEAVITDHHDKRYFATVTRYLLDVLTYRGVRVFYILDNELQLDRFDLTMKLLVDAGCGVVTPYTTDKGPLSFDEVKNDLDIELVAGRHTAYVEIDATVNHLEAVIAYAGETDHLVIFRNAAPPDPKVEILPSQGVQPGELE